MRRIALIALASAGCTTWTFGAPEVRYIPVDGQARIALRPDRLAGAAELTAAGDIAFTLDRARACRAIGQAKVERSVVRRGRLSDTGYAAILVGGLVGLAAGLCCTRHDADGDARQPTTTGAVLDVAAAVLMLAPALAAPSRAERRGVVAVSEDEVLVDDPRRVEVAACTFDPAAELGELELETPWGGRIRAALADGVARFPVVWSGDPDGDWRIVATRSRLAFAWEPTADERDRMRQLIH